MLVRFVAVAIIGMGLLMEGLYVAGILVRHLRHWKSSLRVAHHSVGAWHRHAGRSRTVAEWLSEKLDK